MVGRGSVGGIRPLPRHRRTGAGAQGANRGSRGHAQPHRPQVLRRRQPLAGIYQANRDIIGDNPTRIIVGQVLRIPKPRAVAATCPAAGWGWPRPLCLAGGWSRLIGTCLAPCMTEAVGFCGRRGQRGVWRGDCCTWHLPRSKESAQRRWRYAACRPRALRERPGVKAVLWLCRAVLGIAATHAR